MRRQKEGEQKRWTRDERIRKEEAINSWDKKGNMTERRRDRGFYLKKQRIWDEARWIRTGKGRKMKKGKMTEGTAACCFQLVHIYAWTLWKFVCLSRCICEFSMHVRHRDLLFADEPLKKIEHESSKTLQSLPGMGFSSPPTCRWKSGSVRDKIWEAH